MNLSRGSRYAAGSRVRQAGSLRSPEPLITSGSGFTIIELLIVMGIIVVLAALVFAAGSYVMMKGRRSRAEAEIAAMSAALENYKADNGIYVTNPDTDALNPATTTVTDYTASSLTLYKALSGDTNATRQGNGKSYFAFKPQMLNPAPPSTLTVTSLRDPFGNPYGYSTAKASNPNSIFGYNPTYDFWSVADGSAGTDQSKWIKNW